MRIAHFDPFSGASGDMILGALVDAGLSITNLKAELAKLNLGGFAIHVEPAHQHDLTGTRVRVEVSADQPARDWVTIRRLIETSGLDLNIKKQALSIFSRLAAAEAKIHGTTPDSVHFHEVGGVDAIVDICGAVLGLSLLKIDRVFSNPPRLGSGFARSAHGLIPVPGPATAELLASVNAPVIGQNPGGVDVQAELLTPTGAAILTTLAEFQRPEFAPSSIGYGFGSKELPWPNALRVWIGEMADTVPSGGELLLETNIDDMNPQFLELLVERLFQAGALDVWLTPIQMKKNRPASMVSVICASGKRQELEDVLIRNSSTLGIRALALDRTKAIRRIETVVTKWGDVRIKLRGWHGRVIDAVPEYDDCAAIAREHDIPIREVWNEAHRIAEPYVGRRIAADGAILGSVI